MREDRRAAPCQDINTALRSVGIKPAMAGDVWSDRGVSLLGLTEYFMTEDWKIDELVLAASPFSKERIRRVGAPHDSYGR